MIFVPFMHTLYIYYDNSETRLFVHYKKDLRYIVINTFNQTDI